MRIVELRSMGIRTVMITGDNPRTAATTAEAGVDDFLAQATPADKLALTDSNSRVTASSRCAATAPTMRQRSPRPMSAMHTGTRAARESGNRVDLDSDPTKLIEVVGLGKQLLMTRGALTTFSVANDVAKSFAIIPAMFVALARAPRIARVCGDLSIDFGRRLVRRAGEGTHLTHVAWTRQEDPRTEYLRILIRNLRHKRDAPGPVGSVIPNELGVGYRLRDE